MADTAIADKPDPSGAQSIISPLLVSHHSGDKVAGDKVAGDKVAGDKIVFVAEQAYDVRTLANPYLGLRSFTYDDRDLFAGRDRLLDDLAEQLVHDPPRCLLIQGASGSGKSSLIHAGLVPRLQYLFEQRGLLLKTMTMRPSKQPLAQLHVALAALGLPETTDSIAIAEPMRNLLVIDQFEEVFTQSDKDQADAFVHACSLLPPPNQSGVFIVVALRVDYLPQLFQTYSQFYELLQKQAVNLYPMSADDLRMAILRPLQARHGNQQRGFEPALLERLVADAAGESTALPLLQFTLQDLWDRGSLVSTAYRNLGAAISARASDVYTFWHYQSSRQRSRTPAEGQQLMRLLLQFVHAAQSKDDTHDARVRRSISELVGNDPERQHMIDDLVEARLLSTSAEIRVEGGQQIEVEVVDLIHESLIRTWPELREAIAKNREALQQQALFEIALGQWKSHQKADGYLLDGSRLEEAEAIRTSNDLFWSAEAVELIERSIAQRQKREADRVLLQVQQRSARRLRRSLVMVLALLIVAVAASALAVANLQTANAEKARASRLAQAGEALTELERRPERALALTLGALPAEHATLSETLAYEPLVARALYATADQAHIRQIFTAPDHAVRGAAWSADGKTLVAVVSGLNTDSNLLRWDAGTGAQVGQQLVDATPVSLVQFSPNRRWVFVQDGVGAFHCFDTETFASLPVPDGNMSAATIAWSGDSTHLVLASQSQPLRLWDIEHNTLHMLPISAPDLMQVALSPDRSQVLVGNADGTLTKYSVTTAAPQTSTNRQNTAITALTWVSPTLILAGTEDGEIAIYDGTTLEEQARLVSQGGGIRTIVLDPQGRLALSGGDDGIVRVWDIAARRLVSVLYGHSSAITTVAWSNDGQQILSASADTSVRLWDTTQGLLVRTMVANPDTDVYAVAWSPDGKTVASGDSAGNVQLWDVATGQIKQTLSMNSTIRSLDWNHRTDKIAVGEQQGVVTVLDGTSGAVLWKYQQPDGVWSVAWSNRGDKLASASNDGTVAVLNQADGRVLRQFRADQLLRAVVWSPDDRTLATGSRFASTQLWSATDLSSSPVQTLTQSGVRSMSWAGNNRQLVTSGEDNLAVIWDITTSKSRFTLAGHTDMIRTVSWSPDGVRLATSGADGTLRIWEGDSGSEIYIIRSVGAIWSSAWSPDGHMIVTGSQHGMIQIWQMDATSMQQAIRDRLCANESVRQSQSACLQPANNK